MNCPPSVFAYNAPCAMGPGGIKAVYVADPDNVLLTAMNVAAGAVILGPKTAGAKPFYRWDVAPGQSTLNSQAQINEANNVRFFQTELVAALNGFTPTAAGAMLLSRLTRLAIIAELNSGASVFVGCVFENKDTVGSDESSPRGADVTDFTWTPGQSKDDAVRATLTAHLDSYMLPLSVSNYSNLVND